MSAPSIQKKATEKTRIDVFPADFRDYMGRELKYSLLEGGFNTRWVFWNRQDDTLSNDHSVDAAPDVYANLKVRQNITLALRKLILDEYLENGLVQFWAPTKTKDGRTLLTTQNQPFGLGTSDFCDGLCEYRMRMCSEYEFYADAQSGEEEQLGLPGRVFRNQFPEDTPHVKYYSLKEYPQRDVALDCGIQISWGLPVFEHSSHTCVGVLEIVNLKFAPSYFKLFLDWANDIFQEVGLRSFDGYKHSEMQYGDKNESRTVAFQELKMVYKSVCETHNVPLVLTWVSCRSTNDLLESQFQFINKGYRDENDDDYRDEKDDDYDDDYRDENDDDYITYVDDLNGFAAVSKFCHLRKGQVSGRISPFHNLLYCSDVKQFSIAEYPLVPNARFCKFGGWFTMCLQSSYTGDELYMIEFFLPASKKNDENILSRLRLILATMEEYFKTFKLAFGQEWGEVLSVEVIDFRNDQRCHSIQSIPVVSSSKEGKRKIQDRVLKKGGPRIEIPLEEILKCSNKRLKEVVAEFNVGKTTFKSICRRHGIDRWPPSLQLPVENKGQTPLLNSDLPSNEASSSVANSKKRFRDADTVTIRAKFENSKIKLRMSSSSKLVELQREVAKRLNLEAEAYFIKYEDEEDEDDELTLIVCDEDLQVCIQTFTSLGKDTLLQLVPKQTITPS